jgi:epoxyqueuosine reductase QueG
MLKSIQLFPVRWMRRLEMKKKNTEAEINDFLKGQGIPIKGVSALYRLPDVPENFSPEAILKGAKSVICYGVPIPKGVIYAQNNGLDLYWRYCNMLYRSLDMTSNQLCVAIEEKGQSASPVYGCYPWKTEKHKFWGLLPLVYWAEQAGLGKLTKCGLLANPDYGTRILLGGVLTTLDLEPSEKLNYAPCPSGCLECIAACPVDAIQKTGKVDHDLCIRYSGANPLMTHLLADQKMKENFTFETILNTVGVDDHGSYKCNTCIKVCPLNYR